MSKMNYKQIDHCRDRLRSIRSKLVGKTPLKPDTTDEREFAIALINGLKVRNLQAKLTQAAVAFVQDSNSGRYNADDLLDHLIKIEYEDVNLKALAKYEEDQVVFEAMCAEVDAEVRRVEDQIVLGDQHEALQALDDLENWNLGRL